MFRKSGLYFAGMILGLLGPCLEVSAQGHIVVKVYETTNPPTLITDKLKLVIEDSTGYQTAPIETETGIFPTSDPSLVVTPANGTCTIKLIVTRDKNSILTTVTVTGIHGGSASNPQKIFITMTKQN